MKFFDGKRIIMCLVIQIVLVIIAVVYHNVFTVRGNQYDPHVLPDHGPFFEGWYIRITDDSTSRPLRTGLLFGHVIPEDTTSKQPKVTTSILYSPCDDGNCPLKSTDAFFDFSAVQIKTAGHKVIHDPDDTSPANFRWFATDGISFANFTIENDTTYFEFRLNNVTSMKGKLAGHVAWGPGGIGPEGSLIEHLPLPLDWFVYSLRSKVIEYELIDKSTGFKINSNSGVVHMEKNWGVSFPKAWIWSQGTSDEAYLALSGGLVSIAFLDVPAYLIGYRNFKKNIDVNFNPINSFTENIHDGCSGFANLTVNSPTHKLLINITTPYSLLGQCLYGPMKNGFKKVCVESYGATIEINLYKRDFLQLNLIDNQVIKHSALEFGGSYVCKNQCSDG